MILTLLTLQHTLRYKDMMFLPDQMNDEWLEENLQSGDNKHDYMIEVFSTNKHNKHQHATSRNALQRIETIYHAKLTK
jgi:hypothetical protein